ncbi:GNAT family N-acetyltransferase [Nocardioides albus]|uniref:RimJ/RimL family protein N-acetyltransferase n=1 Tax=Nocardioides albus TaxID=1841 RepID=A0A7W5A949_9ACTN|nr:GNAT family protein [Nocardioides albus]MBB3091963.1 RimJ/RimL family protein N-acetyltransferase [Nocardioides albus]GGU44142.1 acetyltransferase [Nocardioides albus]
MLLVTPTLVTERLRLRPFADSDADQLFALQSDANVLRYWDSPPWTEESQAKQFIARSREMAEEGSGVRMVIERGETTGVRSSGELARPLAPSEGVTARSADDGAFLGWCTLNSWNPDFRSASLGYCLGEAAWGRGVATEAAKQLLGWAFDTLDLNRVQAEADTRNAGSARVLEKLGFTLEGTLREDCVVNGVVSDSWVFGLLRREWFARQPGTAGT